MPTQEQIESVLAQTRRTMYRMDNPDLAIRMSRAGGMELLHRRMQEFARDITKSVRDWSGDIDGYHENSRSVDAATIDAPFRIGFEVEKEDEEVYYSLRSGDALVPGGWIAEHDSSLGDYGFEIVTRAYNLVHFEDLVQDAEYASVVLDAGHSRRCGGHISVSDSRCSAAELAKRIRPFFPLFMTLYPRRMKSSYVKCAKYDETVNGTGHYSPFVVTRDNSHGSRIEFRIPPAVRSARNFVWRAELVRIMMYASYHKPVTFRWMARALGEQGVIRDHLSKVYTDPAVLNSRLALYWAFAEFFFTDRAVRGPVHKYIHDAEWHNGRDRHPLHGLYAKPSNGVSLWANIDETMLREAARLADEADESEV